MTDISVIKNAQRFSFKYDGEDLNKQNPKTNTTVSENTYTTEYLFPDGLKVTNTATFFPEFDAVEYLSWFENTGDEPTKIISEVWDSDISLPFPHQEPYKHSAYIPIEENRTQIHHAPGSTWNPLEFCEKTVCLDVGRENRFVSSGGRPANVYVPMFNASYKNQGVVVGIGWSGVWRCTFGRTEDELLVKSGIERLNFKLLPGERIRTSSTTVMAYDGDFLDGQNKWRRLLKKHFSLIGKPGRDEYAPLCGGLWGGMTSEAAVERINFMKEKGLPFEYVWMDAGWYGTFTEESPDEFIGSWSNYTGDWRINPTHHPDGLLDVSRAIQDAGMKYLLWIEPERVNEGTPIVDEHPEYLRGRDQWGRRLLDLGNEEAWQYCFDTVAGLIEKLNIGCYRQDFNFDPDEFWREGEAEDRQGINEIKYVMGFYKFWDALLERFPNLIIDNCASGGRRIDIETIRRSVPLWRSDLACSADYDPDGVQSQTIGFSTWIPYSGTGTGRIVNDMYRFRSAYTNGINVQALWSARDQLLTDDECEWLKKACEEFLNIRPYLSCDRYPLTLPSANKDVWDGIEYFDPGSDSGIMQIFRRSESPYIFSCFKPRGLDADKVYTITDADTDEAISVSGKELMEDGFGVTIPEPRTAKLYYIKAE